MKYFVKFFLKRIDELCDEKNISHFEVMQRSTLNEGVYYSWSNGKSEPDTKSIASICRALDVELDEFFVGYNNSELTADQSKLISDLRTLSPRDIKRVVSLIDLLNNNKNI